ncbi:hypothetical protein ABPG74_013667 [Tetrahymena malaccensis]
MADRTTFQKNLDDRTFRIRLRNTPQEIDISKNKNFVKVIEHEYACRYLEKLNIEPNQKNIQFILKKYPIKNCDIKSEWNNNNFSADTIVISTRKKEDLNQKYQESQTNLFEELGLKLMKIPNIDTGKANTENDKNQQQEGRIDQNKSPEPNSQITGAASTSNVYNTSSYKEQSQSAKKKQQSQGEGSKERIKKVPLDDKQNKFEINYDIEYIKKNYIFPFNQTTLRKINQNMQENPKYITTAEEKDLVFTNNIFKYPFSQIRIDSDDLHELQKPINITIEDILVILEEFKSKFPREYIPVQNTGQQEAEKKPLYSQNDQNVPKEFRLYNFDNVNEENENTDVKKRKQKEHMDRAIVFEKSQIDQIFNLISSPTMAKQIGLFTHFCYWVIFSEVNIKTIEMIKKKQIFVQMQEHLAQLKQKLPNFKLWLNLTMPMILLTIKMITEYIFKNRYPGFFKEQGRSLNNQGMIAIDKILFLCDKIFDETQISGRFTFLESNFKQQTKINSVQNDRKLLKKRIYATSQNMNFLMENPRSSQARNILAKSNKLNPISQTTQNKLETTSKKKFVNSDIDDLQEEERQKIEKRNKDRISSLVLNRINNKTKSLL